MIAALLIAAACSGDCRAQDLFMTMERKLLSAAPLQLEVRSRAEGSVQADATTSVSIGPAIRLHSRGRFRGTVFEKDLDRQATPDLRDAVVLGLTRMGLMHNVANLAQDLPPDHADGTMRDWLKPVKFRRVKGGVRYSINIEGKDRGETTLLINPRTRMPVKRTAVVRFPGGNMRLTETYTFPRSRPPARVH